MTYHKQIDLHKGLRIASASMLIFMRYSLIGINAIFIVMCMSLQTLYGFINNFLHFWTFNFIQANKKFNDNFFQCLDSALIYMFIFFIYIFLTFFFIFHKKFVQKKITIPLTKIEIFCLLEFYFFGLLFIILSFVGIGSQHMGESGNVWHDLLLYIIPIIDICVFSSLIILNTMCFIDHIWKLYVFHAKHNSYAVQSSKQFQYNVLINVIMYVNMSIVFSLWSIPLEGIISTLLALFSLDANTHITTSYIFTYFMVLVVIAYIIFSVIFLLYRLTLRVRLEKKRKIQCLPTIDIIITIYFLLIMAIFLLTTSVVNMWYFADQNHVIFISIGVINSLFTIPPIFLIIIRYSYVFYRVSHEIQN